MNIFNEAFNLAFIFYIFAGSIYFLFYVLQYNKPFYLLLAFFIYLLSYVVRNKLMKVKDKSGFTEVGLFFISLVFLACTLYIFKLDSNVVAYLPYKILINSGGAFVLFFIFNLINFSRLRNSKIILIILVMVTAKLYQSKIDSIFVTCPWIASFIIGTPYIYLISVLFGIRLHKNDLVK